ncbi:MAG TPA: NUDIX domain-containing protein [Deltaproteobacteria bacterium]|nr:NUDIX domain-containing protein [Deltaproteobacteria bacterium]
MGAARPLRVVSAEIQRDGRYLLTQRSAHAVLPLLWEFPGGRVRGGEEDLEALARAVEHRIGVRIDGGERVLEVRHDYPDYSLILVVYRVEISGEPAARAVEALAWVEPERFGDYTFPGADQKTVDLLLTDID